MLRIVGLLAALGTANAFVPHVSRSLSGAQRVTRVRPRASRVRSLSAVTGFGAANVDPAWLHGVMTGLADAASTAVGAVTSGADATVQQATDVAQAAAQADNGGVFGFLTVVTEQAIIMLHDTLQSIGIQEAYGPSIILFTLFVKAVTFPLTYQQLASTTKMQAVQPKVRDIQKRLASNPEAANKAIAELYQVEEINPLAGCLPSVAQIPIFISLYRALLNLAKEDKLAEAFLWLPSLEGPVYQSPPTETLNWLKTGWDGFNPPLGWHDTLAFLTIPVILVVSQSVSQKLMQPPQQQQQQDGTSQAILKYLPLLIGWFSLNVPSGLGVYWIVNNIFSTAVSVLIRQQLGLSSEPMAATADASPAPRTSEEKGFSPRRQIPSTNPRDLREATAIDDSDDDDDYEEEDEEEADRVTLGKPKGFGADDSDEDGVGEIISAESGKVKKPKAASSGKRRKKSRK